MTDPEHQSLIESSFTQQASTFEDKRFNRMLTTESEWIYGALPRQPSDLVLDVAAGTGLAGRALAQSVRAVVAIDTTMQMLAVGHQAAREEGATNIVFQYADAAALPFLDASFDLVVCRFALHHFPEPDVQLSEINRVLKPGGHFLLADLVAVERPSVANIQNHLERLRDPSHTHALPLSGLQAALARQRLAVVASESRSARRPLNPWMEQTQTPPEAVTNIEFALTGELDRQGPATGFQPQRDETGHLTIVQTLAAVVARKPS